MSEINVDFVRGAYHGCVIDLCEGKQIFWSPEAREGDHTWYGAICHLCYMSPIIGSRHGCLDKTCYIDLCETCVLKVKHDHPLVEYLVPNRPYRFEEIFKTVPYLLGPDTEEKIETKTIWENGIECIGFFLSARGCGACHTFTPKLTEAYLEAQRNNLPFRIAFISFDPDEQSFNEYRSETPWFAIPPNSNLLIRIYFRCPCECLFHFSMLYNNSCSFLSEAIPRLFIVASDGKILSRRGVQDVSRKGVEALKIWLRGERVTPPTADEYEWDEDVSCARCGNSCIIGQLYRCVTCDSYHLCSACEKKGHEHPTELVEQPAHYEDD